MFRRKRSPGKFSKAIDKIHKAVDNQEDLDRERFAWGAFRQETLERIRSLIDQLGNGPLGPKAQAKVREAVKLLEQAQETGDK